MNLLFRRKIIVNKANVVEIAAIYSSILAQSLLRLLK